MSWFSYSSKFLSIFLILPMILSVFNQAELNIYFLFITIIATINIFDFGFKNTFVRLFSYSAAGLKNFDQVSKNYIKNTKQEINWDFTKEIFSTMKRTYLFISLILFASLSTIGTYFVKDSISLNEETDLLWLSWIYIIITSSIGFYGKIYICYLEGFNRVALLKRYEGYFSFLSVLSRFLVIYFYPSIFLLIIVEKSWLIINLIRNLFLCRSIYENKISSFSNDFDYVFFKKVFDLAWKSGFSNILSIGLINFTGIFYSQIGNLNSVNSYLISLRIMNIIRDFSKAPFYSKIPLFSKLRAQGYVNKLIYISKRNILISNIVFFLSVTSIAFFADEILLLINSNADLVNNKMWMLMSLAFYIHRYGSMHMQIYLTTNHVITHIVDSISALIFLISLLFLFEKFEIYSFPISMILSYILCHAWVSSYFSIKSLKTNFLNFDKWSIFVLILIVITQIFTI